MQESEMPKLEVLNHLISVLETLTDEFRKLVTQMNVERRFNDQKTMLKMRDNSIPKIPQEETEIKWQSD